MCGAMKSRSQRGRAIALCLRYVSLVSSCASVTLNVVRHHLNDILLALLSHVIALPIAFPRGFAFAFASLTIFFSFSLGFAVRAFDARV